jgi:hypothetical protein
MSAIPEGGHARKIYRRRGHIYSALWAMGDARLDRDGRDLPPPFVSSG